ncbi:MAG: sodium:solute symporter family protein [Methanomassiliicoccales archaeon]
MVDTAIFWVATIAYMAATFLLAWYGYRRTKTKEDYLLGGRAVKPWIIGLSYGATFISTSAIVGFGGTAAKLGMGLIWLTVLTIGVGVLIAFIVFGHPTRRLGQKLGALTFPDLMGKRFNSRFIRYAMGVLILIMMPLYASAVIIGGAQFINVTLNVNYQLALLGFAILTAAYVLRGGLLAVMYTDAFQGAVMVVGMSAVLIITYVSLGGIDTANLSLTNMSNLVPAGLAGKGMTGWTSMPTFGSEIWLTLITTIVMGVGVGVLAQPQLVVRFMTAKDSNVLDRAVPTGGLFIALMTGVAFTVGALTNVYFYKNYGMISTAYVPNVDQIIPKYINMAMPDVVIVIFMLTLLAAAMSTLSSIFHTMGSAAGHDLWYEWRKNKAKVAPTATSSMRASQWGMVIMIVASVSLAFLMPGDIIARTTAMFMGICASAFLPMFAYGLFSKKPYALAAQLSLVVGAATWFIWTVFFHAAESAVLGICKFFFGVTALLPAPWTVVDPLILAMPAAVIALGVGIIIARAKGMPAGDPA